MFDDKEKDEVRKPTKLSQYKSEVRFLKGQIRRANQTIRMRDRARTLRATLDRLNDNLERGFNPDTNDD